MYILVHILPPTHKYVVTRYEMKFKKKTNKTNTLLKGWNLQIECVFTQIAISMVGFSIGSFQFQCFENIMKHLLQCNYDAYIHGHSLQICGLYQRSVVSCSGSPVWQLQNCCSPFLKSWEGESRSFPNDQRRIQEFQLYSCAHIFHFLTPIGCTRIMKRTSLSFP